MTKQERPLISLSFALCCAAPSLAFAQDAPPPAAPAGPVPAPADAVAPPPSLADVSARVDGMDEALGATRAVVDSLARIKVSGYIQARLELHEFSAAGVDANDRPTIFDRFFVRRGRLKVVYARTNAESLLQIDATGDGVVLKDAEASFIDTWTPFSFKLTGGQFKVPFGYEVLQSSGDREMPERSRFIRAMFPNERDRGVRLTAHRDWFRFAGAVVNGNFIQDAIYPNTDPNGAKDLIGRLGADFDWLVFGVSGSYGKAMSTMLGKAAVVGGTDTNGDGKLTGAELTLTPAVPTAYTAWWRLRYGADLQAYFDVPALGGLSLKGELAVQRDKNADATKLADPCSDVTQLGWYLSAVQNLGEYVGLVFRVDQYWFNLAERSGCTASLMNVPTSRKATTYGGGPILWANANFKLSVIGEKVTGFKVETIPARYGTFDDRITFQMQARF